MDTNYDIPAAERTAARWNSYRQALALAQAAATAVTSAIYSRSYLPERIEAYSNANTLLWRAAYHLVDGEQFDDDGSAEGIVWEVRL